MNSVTTPAPDQQTRTHLRLWLCLFAALVLALLPGPGAPELAAPRIAKAGHESYLALPGHDLVARAETTQSRPLPLAGILPVAPPAPRRRLVTVAGMFPLPPQSQGICPITPCARAPPSDPWTA